MNILIENFMILLGIGLGLLYWIIDSATQSILLGEGELSTQLLRPEAEGILRRLVVFILVVALSGFTHFWQKKHKGSKAKLNG